MLSPPCFRIASSNAAALEALRVVNTMKEALFCKLLGDGSPYAPAHGDGQLAVVERPTVGEMGVAPI